MLTSQRISVAESEARMRYGLYYKWCSEKLLVRPFSFALWRQVEPTLVRTGRIAASDFLFVDPSVAQQWLDENAIVEKDEPLIPKAKRREMNRQANGVADTLERLGA